MKLCRFQTDDGVHCGIVERVGGREVINQIAFPMGSNPFCDEWHTTLTHFPLEGVRLLPPAHPSKIICVGRNYREHAKELGNPVPVELLTFLKPPSSLIAHDQPIVRPRISERVDFEGELGLVIKKPCHKLRDDDDVREYIGGYTCMNDVTARDLQRKDGQWTRGKGFDTFCPTGPFICDEIDPWKGVVVETRVNGEVRQRGTTADFIFSLDVIIRHISDVMTLYPGDLIATGTPAGVGTLKAGDVVEVSVEGVGTLRNPVIDET